MDRWGLALGENGGVGESTWGRYMRISGKRVAAATLAVALLGVTGCSGSGEKQSNEGPAATTPSAQPPLTVAQYQSLLTGMEQRIRPYLAQVVAATSLPAVDTARLQLAAELEKERKSLGPVHAPAALLTEHWQVAAFVDSSKALRQLSVTATRNEKNTCGIPNPTAGVLYDAKVAIYDAVTGSRLTMAGESLARAKISFGKTLTAVATPSAPRSPNRRGVNGKVVQRSGAGGSGRLQITNGDTGDVLVSVVLKDPKKPQASIYVRANSKATLTGIGGSTYRVYFKSGTDWDAARRGFTESCSYEHFLQFFDPRSNWQISLEKTSHGNALTDKVPAF